MPRLRPFVSTLTMIFQGTGNKAPIANIRNKLYVVIILECRGHQEVVTQLLIFMVCCGLLIYIFINILHDCLTIIGVITCINANEMTLKNMGRSVKHIFYNLSILPQKSQYYPLHVLSDIAYIIATLRRLQLYNHQNLIRLYFGFCWYLISSLSLFLLELVCYVSYVVSVPANILIWVFPMESVETGYLLDI